MSLGNSLFGDHAGMLHERDFQALLLANVLPPLGSGLLSPILDSLIDPFGTSAAGIGLMISVFTAPSIAIIPLAGLLADRYGRKPILVAALLLFGTAGLAIAFTTDYRLVLGLRALQGVAFGGCMPIITTSIGDLYAETDETTAQGLRLAGSGLASTVFPLLSGVLVVVAWQYPFLLYAVALPIAVLVARWFDEPAVRTAANSTAAGDGRSLRSRLRALASLLAQRRVAVLLVARGLPTFVWIGFITYNSLVVVRLLGETPTHAGALVAAGSLAFGAAASQAGRLTDRFESRVVPLLVANLSLGGGFVLFLFAPVLALTGLGVVAVGLGFGLALALYRSAITGLADDSLRGSLVSLSEAFGRVVATSTPVLMGAVIAFSTPRLGLEAAVQVAGLGAVAVGSGGGVLCLLLVGSASSGGTSSSGGTGP